MNIILIFIDGLGIGENDPSKNPCAQPGFQVFNHFDSEKFPKTIISDGNVKPIDARFDVDGLPQSATGQTALYTGQNASKILGRHLSGFPTQRLRDVLIEHSIFQKLTQSGKKAAFINAFRPLFFEVGPEPLIRFLSVTTVMNWKAGLKFFSLEDLKNKNSIYHDFTNNELIRKGFNVPCFDEETAGKILAHSGSKFDFCLYEYFKTDRAGHKQDMDKAAALLIKLESFILNVLKNIDLNKTMLVVTSDHGNIEDLSVKTHTKNPVPFIVWGKEADQLAARVNSLLDFTPAVLDLFKINSGVNQKTH